MGDGKGFTIQFGCLISYKGAEHNLIIPDGVTTIGRRAFYSNQQIETITIPESVSVVEQEAFLYCNNLKSITILGRIEKAGKDAFGSLYGKETLELEVYSKVPIRAFTKAALEEVLRAFSKQFTAYDQSTNVFHDNLRFLGTHLKQPQEYGGKKFYHYLSNNDALRHSVLNAQTIPVKDIEWLVAALQEEGNTTFVSELLDYKNLMLQDDKVKRSLEKSKERAEEKTLSKELSVTDWRKLLKFSYENGDVIIKEVKIREPVIELPDHIGKSKVRVIDRRAFAYNLKQGERELWSPEKIILPEGIDEIRTGAFYCAKKTEIFFPNSVKSLPEGCFIAVKNLTLHIPASVQEIADELEWDSGDPAIKVIYAPEGSCAEKYAKAHNIPFVAE